MIVIEQQVDIEWPRCVLLAAAYPARECSASVSKYSTQLHCGVTIRSTSRRRDSGNRRHRIRLRGTTIDGRNLQASEGRAKSLPQRLDRKLWRFTSASMLLPRPRYTVAKVSALAWAFTAFDKHPDVLRTADCAGLVDANPDPRHVEFIRNDSGYPLCERLDELKLCLGW